MAPPASKPSAPAARWLAALLAVFPGRLEFSVRLALICALTTLVAEIYQTPEPALTAYVAFFLIKFDRAASIIVSVVMLLLLTLIIGTLFLITVAVIDEPLWRFTTMALISLCLLFAVSASKLKPIGGIVARSWPTPSISSARPTPGRPPPARFSMRGSSSAFPPVSPLRSMSFSVRRRVGWSSACWRTAFAWPPR